MSDSITVRAGEFEGPLDLLLSLIQERRLYINEISLAEVTDAYLEHIKQLHELSLAETAQFVWVASTLLLIKSRSLLPSMDLTDDEEHDIKELERRLEQYRLVRQGARLLEKNWDVAPLLPGRYMPAREVQFAPGALTVAALSEALKGVISNLPVAAFRPQVAVEAVVSLEEMIGRMRNRILRASRIQFSKLREGASKHEFIVQFLALLELVKGGHVSAEQGGSFDDILVESGEVSAPHYG